MIIDCPCFYFELDPEASVADATGVALVVCACGHLDDEHDEDGDCQAEIEDENPSL